MRSVMATMNIAPIQDIQAAQLYVASFSCPQGFSNFAWKQLQHTALAVWCSHFSGNHYSGSLQFCRPEFYDMLVQPDGTPIVPQSRIERFKAA